MSDELILPPYIYPAKIELTTDDGFGRYIPLSGYQPSARTDYAVGRWRASLSYENLRDAARHALLAFLTRVGRSRAFMLPIYGEEFSGVGAFPELFGSTTFADGLTGWTGSASVSRSVSNRVFRGTRVTNTNVNNSGLINTSGDTCVQFAPIVFRVVITQGKGDYIDEIDLRLGDTSAALTYGLQTTQDYGYRHLSGVPYITTCFATVLDNANNQLLAGDYWEIPWLSLTRCGLVDAGQNYCTHSDDFSNAAWTKTRCTVAATVVTLPHGSTGTVNTLTEDATAGNNHFVEDSITVTTTAGLDFSISVALKAANRTWARISILESSGSGEVYTTINLSTGAIGTSSAGTNWADVRAFSQDMGNSWYKVSLVARKTLAGTAVTFRIFAGEADNDITFTGLSQDSIYMWRATFSQSSVPTRLVATTGTANTVGVAQSGNSIYTKGWVAATNGVLAAGDLINIHTANVVHLARVTSALVSDGAGLGHLRFEPSVPESVIDNAVIVVTTPLVKCMLTGDPTVTTEPGDYTSSVRIEVESVF